MKTYISDDALQQLAFELLEKIKGEEIWEKKLLSSTEIAEIVKKLKQSKDFDIKQLIFDALYVKIQTIPADELPEIITSLSSFDLSRFTNELLPYLETDPEKICRELDIEYSESDYDEDDEVWERVLGKIHRRNIKHIMKTYIPEADLRKLASGLIGRKNRMNRMIWDTKIPIEEIWVNNLLTSADLEVLVKNPHLTSSESQAMAIRALILDVLDEMLPALSAEEIIEIITSVSSFQIDYLRGYLDEEDLQKACRDLDLDFSSSEDESDLWEKIVERFQLKPVSFEEAFEADLFSEELRQRWWNERYRKMQSFDQISPEWLKEQVEYLKWVQQVRGEASFSEVSFLLHWIALLTKELLRLSRQKEETP